MKITWASIPKSSQSFSINRTNCVQIVNQFTIALPTSVVIQFISCENHLCVSILYILIAKPFDSKVNFNEELPERNIQNKTQNKFPARGKLQT